MTIAAYATPEQLREYLNQLNQQATPGSDAVLGRVLERARSAIDTALGFRFHTLADAWPAASTRVILGVIGARWLRLEAYKAGSVTSVVSREQTPATLTDWREDWDGCQFGLYRAGAWRAVAYDVTAIWGYGPPPEVVVQVNLALAVNYWRARDKGGFTEVVGAEGGGSIKMVGELTQQQRATLAEVRAQYVDPLTLEAEEL